MYRGGRGKGGARVQIVKIVGRADKGEGIIIIIIVMAIVIGYIW
jgi:hypothetical protein